MKTELRQLNKAMLRDAAEKVSSPHLGNNRKCTMNYDVQRTTLNCGSAFCGPQFRECEWNIAFATEAPNASKL
jgi:hypothetical protein